MNTLTIIGITFGIPLLIIIGTIYWSKLQVRLRIKKYEKSHKLFDKPNS